MSFIDTKVESVITTRKCGSFKMGIIVSSYKKFSKSRCILDIISPFCPFSSRNISIPESCSTFNYARRQFYKLADSYLVVNTTSTRHLLDQFDCSFLCLRYEPFACLSFNMARNSDNSYHTCGLSSSERYVEPQRMERLGFDYYGTTTEVCDTSYLIVVLGGVVCYNYNRDQTVDDYFSLLWSHLIDIK